MNTLPVKLRETFEITLFDANHNELLGDTNSLFSACDIESQNISIYPLSCPAGSLNIFASVYLACNSTNLSPAQRVMMFVSVAEHFRVCPLQLTLQTQLQPTALTIAENTLSKDYNANSVTMSLLINCEDIDLYSAAIQNTIQLLEKFLNNSFFVNDEQIVIQAWTITATTFQAIGTPKRLRRQVLPSPTPVQPQITESQGLGSGDNSSDEYMSESIGKATSSILPDPFPTKTTSTPFPFVTSMLLDETSSSSLDSSIFSLFPDISSLSLEPSSPFLSSVYESILSSDLLLFAKSSVDFTETLTIMTSDISSDVFLSSLSTETSSSVTISPTFIFLTPTPSDDIFFTSETSIFLYDTSSMDSLVMPTIDPSQMPYTSLDSDLLLTSTDVPFIMTSSVVIDMSSDFTSPSVSDETSLIFVDTTSIETFVEKSNLGSEFVSPSEFPFITSPLDVSLSETIFQTSVAVGVSPSGDLTSFLSNNVLSQTSVDFIETLSPSPSQPFFSFTADDISTVTLESPSPSFEEPFSSVFTELFSSIKLTPSPFPSIIPPPPGPPPPSLDTPLVTESSDLFLETSSFLPPFSTNVIVTSKTGPSMLLPMSSSELLDTSYFIMTSSVVIDMSSEYTSPSVSDETSLIFVDTTPIETFVEKSNLGSEFVSPSEFPFITSSLDVSLSETIFQTSVAVGVSPSGDLTSFLSNNVLSQTSVDFIETLSPSPSQPFFSFTADDISTVTLESPSPSFEEPFSSVFTELFSSIKLTPSPFPSIIPPPPGPPPPSLDTPLVTESSDLFLETSSFLPPFSTNVIVTSKTGPSMLLPMSSSELLDTSYFSIYSLPVLASSEFPSITMTFNPEPSSMVAGFSSEFDLSPVLMSTPEPTSSLMLLFSSDFDESPVSTSSEPTLISSIETPFSSDFDDSLVPTSSEPTLISSTEMLFSSDFDDSQLPMSTLFPELSSSMKSSFDFDGSLLLLSTPLPSFSISTIASEEFPSTLVLLPSTEIKSPFDLQSSPEPSLLIPSDSIVSSILISEDITSSLESVATSTIFMTSSFTFTSSVLFETSSIDIVPSSTETRFSSDDFISSSFDFSSGFSEFAIETTIETLFVLGSSIDSPTPSSSFISSSSESSSTSPSFMEISSFFDESTLSLLFAETFSPSTSISESLFLSPFVSASEDFSSFESSVFSSSSFITTPLFSDLTAFISESIISDSIFFSETLSPFDSFSSSHTVSISMTQTSSSLPSPSPTDVAPIGPILVNPLGTLVAIQGILFSYTIPNNMFLNAVSLDLLNDTTDQSLRNSPWVQLKSNIIQGLAMASEIINGDITDHYFKLQAYGENGTNASQIIRIRVFPNNLLLNNNFVQISVEGDFLMIDQNLSAKIDLSSKIAAPKFDDIYFLGFSDGSIVVTYTNISIRDYDCVGFTNWFQTIYTNNDYTVSFRKKVLPFVPLGVAKIIGTCGIRASADVFTTSTPILGIIEISDKLILLTVVLPIIFVACLLLMVGTIVFMTYRRKRWERSYVPSRELYLNRKPVILPGELEGVPYRSRKPTILTDELPRRTRQGYRSFLYPPSYDPVDPFVEDDNVSMESENGLSDFPIVTISEPLKEFPPPPYRLPPEIN